MKSLIEAECDHIEAVHKLNHFANHSTFEEHLAMALEVRRTELAVEDARSRTEEEK